jgi:hypothetical protein
MTNSDTKYPLLQNTIESFKSLIAYDLSSCRVVFEHEGDEIVFVNEAWLGRVRVYLNGDLAYQGWDWTLMIRSSGWFLHQGKTYKISSKVTNLISYSQQLTLSVDGQEVDTKLDDMYGKLSLKEIIHIVLGAGIVGVLIVVAIRLLSGMLGL